MVIYGIKALFVWYLIIVTGTGMITFTNAAVNDVEKLENHLGAGYWVWDRSSLQFSEAQQDYGFCANGIKGLFSKITNVGDRPMAGTTPFEINYVLSGPGPNAINPGVKVYTGEIPALKNGESVLLQMNDLSLVKPGKYKFKAYQRPGHSDPQNNNPNADLREIWGQYEIIISQSQLDACKGVPTLNSETNEEGKTTEDEQSSSDQTKNDAIGTTTETPTEEQPVEQPQNETESEGGSESKDGQPVDNNSSQEDNER